jgi:hypothetical protein
LEGEVEEGGGSVVETKRGAIEVLSGETRGVHAKSRPAVLVLRDAILGCRARRRTWSTTCCRAFLCGNGSSPFLAGLASCWPRDPELITLTLDRALRAIFAFQHGRARRAGASAPRAGAVSCVQRFGGALNLNAHFHCVIPDGVFVDADAAIRFVALPAASGDELAQVLGRIFRRIRKLLRPRLDAVQADASFVPRAFLVTRRRPPARERPARSRICAAMEPGRRSRRIVSLVCPTAASGIA